MTEIIPPAGRFRQRRLGAPGLIAILYAFRAPSVHEAPSDRALLRSASQNYPSTFSRFSEIIPRITKLSRRMSDRTSSGVCRKRLRVCVCVCVCMF